MVSVYRIYDEQDPNYAVWYGDIDDIIDYIEEQVNNYDPAKKSWEEEMTAMGLTFQEIYNKE